MKEFGQSLIEKMEGDPNLPEFSAATVSTMHIFNIIVGIVMLVIGGILLFTVRKQKVGGGKRVAGWILVGLGCITTVTHILQIFL